MKKRKVLYISGTRADYGLLRPTLFAIKNHPKLTLNVVATGMHLMPEFGKTIKEIERDGFKIYPVKAVFGKDGKDSTVKFVGELLLGLLKKIKEAKPDVIFVQGDRPEALAGALVGAYLGIPVAHTHGGDITLTADEITRHAVTKTAHIHFPATQKSAKRILKLGEDAWRVHVVGSPGLDSILGGKLISKTKVSKKYNLNLSKPIILVIQHPTVNTETDIAGSRMEETMEAIKELGHQTVVIYPNADPGSRAIVRVIEKYRKYPFIKIYKNLPHIDYLSLMNLAQVLVGNSSSGIVEAPSFKLPVINVGEREAGRERADNVIDVGYDKEQIKKGIKKAIYNKQFRKRVEKCRNPYGDGKACVRIARILSEIKIDRKLLQKQITY